MGQGGSLFCLVKEEQKYRERRNANRSFQFNSKSIVSLQRFLQPVSRTYFAWILYLHPVLISWMADFTPASFPQHHLIGVFLLPTPTQQLASLWRMPSLEILFPLQESRWPYVPLSSLAVIGILWHTWSRLFIEACLQATKNDFFTSSSSCICLKTVWFLDFWLIPLWCNALERYLLFFQA